MTRNIEQTIDWFNSVYELNKKQGDGKSSFYCGITDNVERRQNEHNVSHFLAVTKCDSFETAKTLEYRMQDEGYDVGNQVGNGNQASVFCYIYKKSSDTKE